MDRLQRTLEAAERVMEWIGSAVLVAMLIISVAEIFARDVLSAPISGSLDLTLLIMIWMVLLVSGIGVRSDLHIRVAFFVDDLPDRVKQIISLFIFACILFFGLAMALQSIPLIELPGIMPELGISNGWLFAPLLVGGILTIATAAERMLRIIVEILETAKQ